METINFGAGPGKLPRDVLCEVQKELLNYNNSGISVLELSHRGPDYASINDKAQQSLKELLNIPDNYKVLLMQGGGTGLFAAIATNLIGKTGTADYIVTGLWSEKAAKEAQKYGNVNYVLPKTENYFNIPPQTEWKLDPNASYVYYCTNETISGIEFNFVPDTKGVPLVADMSSNFLSHPIDVSKFGLIFAGAQKNFGPAGICVVIIRDDLLGSPLKICPSILDFGVVAKANSIYNTPPCFTVYFIGKVFEWIKKNGGLHKMAEWSSKKSSLLYNVIDNSKGFYVLNAAREVRSKMNIVFRIRKESLEQEFINEAKTLGMIQLKGHRSIGGLRASLYNAVSVEETQKLETFMKLFQEKNASSL